MPVELSGVSTVILDIEGTVCPISFVKDVLYPYSIEHLAATVEAQWSDSSFIPYKSAFPGPAQVSPKALCACVRDLVARDVKDSALKKLQGLLWREGYQSGEVVTPLFEDVVPVLKKWHGDGIELAIFSSGSVEAQKLFFKYIGIGPTGDATEDLNPLFNGYFDTVNAGPKKEAASYKKICKELGKEVGGCLFLSDNVEEIFAAERAEMRVVTVDRPSNAPISARDREAAPLVTSLTDIVLKMQ